MRNLTPNLLSEALKGAIAGAAGVWTMDRVGWYMYLREDPKTLQRELAARPGGMDPAHNIANRLARMFGQELTPNQPHPWGVTVHFALGIVPGALYGVLRHRVKVLPQGQGLVYGLGLFVLNDELINAALRLSGPPQAYPWQAHARGLVEHVVLGMITDGVLRVMDRELHPPQRQDVAELHEKSPATGSV